MSFTAQSWAMDVRTSLTAKAVLMVLAFRADDSGRCYPSLNRIAEDACMSERAARNAIVSLVENGLIEREERSGNSSFYTLKMGQTPASGAAPAGNAPLHEMPPTPAPDASPPGTSCPPPRHLVPDTPAPRAPKSSVNHQEGRKEVERASLAPTAVTIAKPASASNVVPIDPRKRTEPAKGTRLSADWTPSAADRDFAEALGLDPNAVAPKFRDHWAGKGHLATGRKSDWPATWRNWCRTDAERRGNRLENRRPTSADNRAAALDSLFMPDPTFPAYDFDLTADRSH